MCNLFSFFFLLLLFTLNYLIRHWTLSTTLWTENQVVLLFQYTKNSSLFLQHLLRNYEAKFWYLAPGNRYSTAPQIILILCYNNCCHNPIQNVYYVFVNSEYIHIFLFKKCNGAVKSPLFSAVHEIFCPQRPIVLDGWAISSPLWRHLFCIWSRITCAGSAGGTLICALF